MPAERGVYAASTWYRKYRRDFSDFRSLVTLKRAEARAPIVRAHARLFIHKTGATPRPISLVFYQPSPCRILLGIANRLENMLLIADQGVEVLLLPELSIAVQD